MHTTIDIFRLVRDEATIFGMGGGTGSAPAAIERAVKASRLGIWLVAVGAAVVAVGALEPRFHSSPLFSCLETAVIVSYAVAGYLFVEDDEQRGNGLLLLAAAGLETVKQLPDYRAGPFPVIGWDVGALSAALVAIVLLRYPRRQLHDRWERSWVALTFIWALGWRVTYALPPPELRRGWWPAFGESAAARSFIDEVFNTGAVIIVLLFLLLLFRRLSRCRGLERRELTPVLVAAVAGVSTVILHLISVWADASPAHDWVVVLEALGLLSVPASLLVAAVMRRLARVAVADLVVRLDRPIAAADLETALGGTLSDPSLRLLFWIPSRSCWVDAGGAEANRVPERGHVAVTIDDTAGGPLAMLLMDADTTRNSALLVATVNVSRLALENAQLQTSLLASLAEVRDSRARLAQAAMDERRKVERDLHDGVQQRMLALSMTLTRARQSSSDPISTELIELARTELRTTLSELRDIARGIHPAILTDSGLAAAVESAVDRMPANISVRIPATRWRPVVEYTAYYVISEALANAIRYAGDCAIEVTAAEHGSTLTVEVRDDGRGNARLDHRGSGLPGLRDRLSAVGGTLRVESIEGAGTQVIAEIPMSYRDAAGHDDVLGSIS